MLYLKKVNLSKTTCQQTFPFQTVSHYFKNLPSLPPSLPSFRYELLSTYPCQEWVRHAQNALPVHPGKIEALGGSDGSDVDGDGLVGSLRDGDPVYAQPTLPVALGVPDGNSTARGLEGGGPERDTGLILCDLRKN